MDEPRIDTACSQLAYQVAHEAIKGLGKKWRCPHELRTEIVAYSVGCREDGETLGAISARLGLVESTLARWLRKKKRAPIGSDVEPGFRSVAIVPSNEAQRSAGLRQLRLITTDGHVVEGLDLESAAYLLKALQ